MRCIDIAIPVIVDVPVSLDAKVLSHAASPWRPLGLKPAIAHHLSTTAAPNGLVMKPVLRGIALTARCYGGAVRDIAKGFRARVVRSTKVAVSTPFSNFSPKIDMGTDGSLNAIQIL